MRISRVIILSILSVVFSINVIVAQNARPLPPAKVQTLEGRWMSIEDVVNHDGPVVLSFWATWCKPCILELNNIMDVYEDWQEETNVKLVAVSIDDARNTVRVGPTASGKGWPYDIVLDPNGELKRSLNVNLIPHTFLLNEEKEIVWSHMNYVAGDEEELFEEISKLSTQEGE